MELEQLVQACHPVQYEGANGFPLTVWRLPTGSASVPQPRRVLCIHGFLDSGRSFVKLAQHLPSNYEIYAPDLRAHGGSRPLPPGSATHYWEHAKDISVLLDTFKKYDQAFDLIIGHSMGANVAALVLGSRTELNAQLLILDILGGIPEKPERQPERFGAVLKGLTSKKDFNTFNTREEAIARLRAMNPHLSSEGARLMALTNLEPISKSGFRFAFEKDLKGKTPFRFPQEFWLSLFSNIKNKAWVVRGEQGLLPTGEEEPIVQERLSAIGLTQAYTLANKGHHLHVDAADEVASFVLSLPALDEDKA